MIDEHLPKTEEAARTQYFYANTEFERLLEHYRRQNMNVNRLRHKEIVKISANFCI